jgi:hypothetical protein
MASLEIFIDISFRTHYGPGVDSVSNINEYQEYFLEVKAAGADCLKIWEPPGTLRACQDFKTIGT